jgi:hypothetical protein
MRKLLLFASIPLFYFSLSVEASEKMHATINTGELQKITKKECLETIEGGNQIISTDGETFVYIYRGYLIRGFTMEVGGKASITCYGKRKLLID